MITEITDSNFDQIVLQSSSTVFVDCFTEWCGPCKSLKPILSKVEEANSDKMTLGMLDIEQNPALAARLKVTSIPKVIVFHKGEEIESFSGLRPQQDYEDILSDLN